MGDEHDLADATNINSTAARILNNLRVAVRTHRVVLDPDQTARMRYGTVTAVDVDDIAQRCHLDPIDLMTDNKTGLESK